MEELLLSEELVGVDFGDLATYFQSAYMQEYSNWFWVEGAAEGAKEGEAKAERGGSHPFCSVFPSLLSAFHT